MGRYIVMDVVFYGNSLNYDQGSGNYQELKKITKWDGKQYTLVSRYALRYSILETANKMGLWDVADGSKLYESEGGGEQKVIQPAPEILLSGEILKYPEFDLFGYLITQPRGINQPQNFRTAPVKISHAVSLTPFSYDALFNANVGLANRRMKVTGKLEPNPFTAEEHETFYQYTVVVDVNNIGNLEVYVNEGENIQLGDGRKLKIKEIKSENDSNGDEEKVKIEFGGENDPIVQFEDEKIKLKGEISLINNKLKVIKYSLKEKENEDPVKKRVETLIKTILNLKRSIKGREEDLSPKLMIVGIYKNNPYKTYKDKISLIDEYCEEEYDEVIEKPLENGRKIKIKHVVSKSKKPVFEVKINGAEKKELSENEVIKFIKRIFYLDMIENMKKDGKTDDEIKEALRNEELNDIQNFLEKYDENEKKIFYDKVKVFYDPSVECKLCE